MIWIFFKILIICIFIYNIWYIDINIILAEKSRDDALAWDADSKAIQEALGRRILERIAENKALGLEKNNYPEWAN